MRVGIGLGDTTMGGAPGMPDGDIAGQACQCMSLDHFVNLAGIFPDQQLAIAQRSYPG